MESTRHDGIESMRNAFIKDLGKRVSTSIAFPYGIAPQAPTVVGMALNN